MAQQNQMIHQKAYFTGNATDYFGIWITNILLSLVTLGIYSAWAKVRRETYFKNNTILLDQSFGYHATGMQILKGRILVLGILVISQALIVIEPRLAPVFYIGLFFLSPWAINAGLRFSARMTSYRNVRFNWHGTYWKTLWFFIVAPVCAILSFGLLLPLIWTSWYRYYASFHSYGKAPFVVSIKVGQFYRTFIKSTVIPTVIIVFLLVLLQPVISGLGTFIALSMTVIQLYLVISLILINTIYTVLCRNILIRGLSLDDGCITFGSDLHPGRLFWIWASNLGAKIISLGLLSAWAHIRIYRYLTQSIDITTYGNMTHFVDDMAHKQSSFGEEFAESEGLDISL